MKDEAEINAESDRRMKEEVDKMNTADGLIFSTEKQIKEYGDKIPADKKQPIESALNDLKEAHKNRNIPGIDTAMAALNAAWQVASEEMYKATQNTEQPGEHSQAGQEEPQAKNPDQEVTDVDFEEVK